MRSLFATIALLMSTAAFAKPAPLTVAVVDDAATTAITARLACPDATCPTPAPIEALRKAHPNLRVLATDRGFEPLVIGPATALEVKTAEVVKRETGGAAVSVVLTEASGKRFADLTEKAVKKKLAILVGDRAQSAPIVQDRIAGGRLIISLGLKGDPAKLLAALKGD